MCPGERPSRTRRESDRHSDSHILLNTSERGSVNAIGYVSNKDSETVENPPTQLSSQRVPRILQETSCASLQTLGVENVLNHTENVGSSKDTGNVNTIATKKTDLQGNCTRVVVGIPEPTKSTKFVALSTFYYAADRDEEHVRRQASNSSGTTHFCKVVTRGEKVVEPKANRRMSQRILARSLSANTNGGIGYIFPNIKAPTNCKEQMLGIGGFPETCSLSRGLTKRKTSLSVDAGVTKREKIASSYGKFPKKQVKASSHNSDPGKLLSDVFEPRRSSRISQPTLRLLEGLQTSFIPRTCSVPHEKGPKLSAGTRETDRSKNCMKLVTTSEYYVAMCSDLGFINQQEQEELRVETEIDTTL